MVSIIDISIINIAEGNGSMVADSVAIVIDEISIEIRSFKISLLTWNHCASKSSFVSFTLPFPSWSWTN